MILPLPVHARASTAVRDANMLALRALELTLGRGSGKSRAATAWSLAVRAGKVGAGKSVRTPA